MKNTMIRTLLTFALATFGAMTAAAQQQKVEITGAGSSGIQPAKVAAGSKTNASVLLSVIDNAGKPVAGQAANMVGITLVIPGGAPCGMNASAVAEVKPGIYQMTLGMPALAQCVWVAGDYMAVARIGTVSYMGMAPFMVSVR